jgi:hypothetical protein
MIKKCLKYLIVKNLNQLKISLGFNLYWHINMLKLYLKLALVSIFSSLKTAH